MDKMARYIETIRRYCGELSVDAAVFNRDGQYNDVLIVNGCFVFRFAKVTPAIDSLRQEVAILRYLQDKTTLPIPEPSYYQIDSGRLGEVFIGYRLIAGRPLWRPVFQEIQDEAGLRGMARQLATFLRELHQIDEPALLDKLPITDHIDRWREMYVQVQRKLYRFMRPSARATVSELFEGYLNDESSHHFEPALRHGDFGTGNILFDADKCEITGIIDFGAAAVGDPATDFAGLYACYGESFYEMCVPFYPEMASGLERVKFFCGTFALQEALFGFDHNDEEAFRSGIEEYA